MSEVELVDVVDHGDHVIGVLDRGLLADRGANFRVVHVLLLDAEGRLLLQRPAASLGKTFRLGSSVAGHVRAGESYETAAARELAEELGVRPGPLTFVGKTWLDEGSARKFIGVFAGTEVRDLAPDPREVDSMARLKVSEVRALLRGDSADFSSTFALHW